MSSSTISAQKSLTLLIGRGSYNSESPLWLELEYSDRKGDRDRERERLLERLRGVGRRSAMAAAMMALVSMTSMSSLIVLGKHNYNSNNNFFCEHS